MPEVLIKRELQSKHTSIVYKKETSKQLGLQWGSFFPAPYRSQLFAPSLPLYGSYEKHMIEKKKKDGVLVYYRTMILFREI